MQKKIKSIIDEVNYEDLYKMREDLENGGVHLKKLVDKKIGEIEEDEIKTCATCGNQINLLTTGNFELIFGPPDLRKRAYFCALDCLEYFVQKLKNVEMKKVKNKIMY